jgi:hypothetical protein
VKRRHDKRWIGLAAAITGVTSVAAFLSLPLIASAHPLHTSLTEIAYDPATKQIRIMARIFVDDLSKAAAARAAKNPSKEIAILAYARASLIIADRAGRVMPLASCGGKRVGDLMWLCFQANAPSGAAGLQVADRILFDLYADQINIVQSTYGGKKISMLFTPGDGYKRLD